MYTDEYIYKKLFGENKYRVYKAFEKSYFTIYLKVNNTYFLF